MTRNQNGTEIDYTGHELKIHLPKRYQEMFLGLLDLEKLCDVVLVIPEYHAAKWEEKEDAKMNSIPFLIIMGSKKTLND